MASELKGVSRVGKPREVRVGIILADNDLSKPTREPAETVGGRYQGQEPLPESGYYQLPPAGPGSACTGVHAARTFPDRRETECTFR